MQQKQLKAKKREAYGGTHEGLRWLCVGPGKRKACTGHSVAPWCCPGSPHRPRRWPHRWPGTRPCQSGICQNGHCSYSLQTKTDRRYLAPRFLALAPLLSTFNTGLLVIHIISVSQTDYSIPGLVLYSGVEKSQSPGSANNDASIASLFCCHQQSS